MMKRWMALLLCACLLLPLLPAGALAEDTADMPAEPAVTEDTVPAVQDQATDAETEENIDLYAPLTAELPVQVNPLYEGIVDPSEISRPQRPDIRPEDGLKPHATYVTEENAAVQVRNYLKSRSASFTVYVKSDNYDYDEIVANLLTIAFSHTGKPTEGDYLQWQWESLGGSVTRTYVNGYYEHQLTFEFTYYTTAQQEKEMDTAVKNLLRTLNVTYKSDYQKVCAVYDYICDNVTYDYAHLEDTSYTRMFTAYAALMDKTAVCQGYALLFYRLMLELGVDNRLIAGVSGEVPHAWNIVKLGDVYYNVDSTWDAGMEEYSFFLKNTVNFPGHARYLDYMSTEFHTEYPMSETDYVDGVAGVPETFYVFGSCGDEAYWKLDRKGNLIISGEGGTYDYTDYGTVEDFYPWIYWANNINALVVEEGVTYLGAYTFCHMDTLTSVSTPASVREIANNAFEDCDGLKKVSFANGLVKIGASAFSSCDALEAVTLPGSVTQIGNSAFANCIGLKELNLTEGLTSIGSYSFQYCTTLTEVVLPDSVAEVAIGAFWSCNALTDVKLSASLTEIPASMFSDCKNLTNVTIPEGVAIVGNYAFNNTALETLSFPKSLKTINANAFSYCTKLREIQFAQGLETIEQDAFARCPALKEVVIPASVTNLNGFLGCQGLEKVILNNSGVIGNYAFADCTSLKEIEFNGEITEIGTAAFGGCAGLTELNLPDTLITLDGFNRCSGLTEVCLPDSVKTVGGFIRCENLEYVDLNQCETILTYGLSECTKLESITIPETMRQIQDSAFFGCSALKEVTFLGDAPEIHENAFNAVTTTAYYPGGNATWTEDVLRDYGGDITWVPLGPDVEFVGASLSLKGDIGLNFYAMLSDRILADTGAYMKFTGSGAARYMAVSDGILDPSDGSYRFTIPLNAKNMGDDVTAQVYNANGTVGDSKTLSIKYYADYVINNSSKESFVNLMKAMLNYGAAAQVNFGYDVENLVNSDMAEADRLLPEELGLCGYAHTWSGEEPGIEVTSASLLLQSETKIRIYFKLNEGYELSDFVFTVDGAEVTPVQSGEEYYIEKPNVAAKDLDTMYTFCLGNRQLVYCGLSYVNQVLAYSSNEKLLNLARALYAYNQAANAYFQPDEAPAHGHNYESVVTEPTCTEGGYTTHTCTLCGDSYTDTETDALGHDWGEWTVTLEPTVDTEGEETRTCSTCGATETRTVDELPEGDDDFCEFSPDGEHAWRDWVSVYDENGNRIGSERRCAYANANGEKCDGYEFRATTESEGDPDCTDHEWGNWFSDNDGSYGSCTKCGRSITIDKSGSNFSEEVVTIINEYRAAEGLDPVAWFEWNHLLIRAHELTVYFSHNRPDGSRGVETCIAAGYGSAQAVVDGWMGSGSHRGSLVNPDATEASAVYNGSYWVLYIG